MRKRKQRKKLKQEEKQRMNKSRLIGYLLIGVMVFSIGAVILSNPETQNAYNGFQPVQTAQGWTVKINGAQVFFSSHPQNVEHHSVPADLVSLLRENTIVVLTFDPSGMGDDMLVAVDYGRFSLAQDLQSFDTILYGGVTDNTTGYDLPSITCEGGTEANPVLQIEKGNATEIVREDHCYRIRGDSPYSLIGLLDALRYRLYRVIE